MKPTHLTQDLCTHCHDRGFVLWRSKWDSLRELDCDQCPRCICSGRCSEHEAHEFQACARELLIYGRGLIPADARDYASTRLPHGDRWVTVEAWLESLQDDRPWADPMAVSSEWRPSN